MGDILDTASYDQFTDFKHSKLRVIFSYNAYKHFFELIKESEEAKKETGCFFFGKTVKEQNREYIVIDSFSSNFAPASGVHGEGSAVDVTPESQRELRESIGTNNYNCGFHFHVHTSPEGSHFEVFSDQDLKVYQDLSISPWFQYYTKSDIERIIGQEITDQMYEKCLHDFLNDVGFTDTFKQILPTHKKTSYFGLLATPNRPNDGEKTSNYQISLLHSEPTMKEKEIKGELYLVPQICYIDKDNNICEIGSFKRKQKPLLTGDREIADNKVEIPIQAIGNNPNGNEIQDVVVGRFKDGKLSFYDKNIEH